MANILYKGKCINNYYWGIPDPPPHGGQLEPLWTPLSVANLQMWLEAKGESANFSLSGSQVVQWLDLSPTPKVVAQSTALARPAYTYSDRVSFDGVDDALIFPAGFMHNWSQFSMFFLMSGPAQQNDCFFGPLSAAQSGLELVWTSVASLPTLVRINNVNKFTTGLYSDDSNYAITSLVANSSSTSGRKNGSIVTPTNATGISPLNFNGNYTLGQYASSFGNTYFGQFNIKELLIYNATLSASDIERVEGYLAFKWGFGSLLPANHPYKTTPPFAT